jgi:5-methyltetrahydrofolate corrinoid/iron sulfur protein methyltransferase
MLIIAERINATRKRIARAMQARDAAFIAREVKKQARAGANFIDVNAGTDPAREIEDLKWAVEVVQSSTDLPLCIDSAGAAGFKAALGLVKGRDVMLNSVNGETERMAQILPVAAERKARLVGLLMDERGLPKGVDDRMEIASKIVNAATRAGIPIDRLYIDPCVQPLSTSPDQAAAVIATVRKVMAEFPGIHTTGGLSNISFGLPYRAIINRVFVTLLIGAGLDAAIIDPTERDMLATILAAEALCGKDEWCMNYIQAERQGLLRPDEPADK